MIEELPAGPASPADPTCSLRAPWRCRGLKKGCRAAAACAVVLIEGGHIPVEKSKSLDECIRKVVPFANAACPFGKVVVSGTECATFEQFVDLMNDLAFAIRSAQLSGLQDAKEPIPLQRINELDLLALGIEKCMNDVLKFAIEQETLLHVGRCDGLILNEHKVVPSLKHICNVLVYSIQTRQDFRSAPHSWLVYLQQLVGAPIHDAAIAVEAPCRVLGANVNREDYGLRRTRLRAKHSSLLSVT